MTRVWTRTKGHYLLSDMRKDHAREYVYPCVYKMIQASNKKLKSSWKILETTSKNDTIVQKRGQKNAITENA